MTRILAFLLSISVICAAGATKVEQLPPLNLNANERQALRRLIVATIDEQEGMGDHLSDTYSFYQFAQLLEIRIRSNNLEGTLARTLDWSPYSPARAWLVDQRINPLMGVVADVLLNSEKLPDAVDRIAKETGMKASDVEKQLKQISFRTTEGVSLATNQKLGFIFNDKGATSGVTSRAFELNEQNQPKTYDIGIQNLKDHVEEMRRLVERTAKASDQSIGQRFAGYFISLEPRFVEALNVLETFELGIIDLQGVLDSIRYKMTLDAVDTARELESLQALLREATELREKFLVMAEGVEASLYVAAPKGRLPLFSEANRWAPQVEGMRRKIKRFCDHAIAEMDMALGFDADSDLKLRFDTPWELAFVSDKAAAQGLNLSARWEEIRTFELLTEEKHYTAHWTTTVHHPATTDANGKHVPAWTETKHHNTSEDKPQYKTIPTPSFEMQVQARIVQLTAAVADLAVGAPDKRKVEAVAGEIRKLKSEYSEYRQHPPRGEDESEHQVPRLRNQLAQIGALETQVMVAQARSNSSVSVFDRQPILDGSESAKIQAELRRIDKRRHAISIGIGSAIGIGAAALTCFQILQPGVGM